MKREHFVTDGQTDGQTEKVTPRAPVGAKNKADVFLVIGKLLIQIWIQHSGTSKLFFRRINNFLGVTVCRVIITPHQGP